MHVEMWSYTCNISDACRGMMSAHSCANSCGEAWGLYVHVLKTVLAVRPGGLNGQDNELSCIAACGYQVFCGLAWMSFQELFWLLPGAFCVPWFSGTVVISWGGCPRGGLHWHQHCSLDVPGFRAPETAFFNTFPVCGFIC